MQLAEPRPENDDKERRHFILLLSDESLMIYFLVFFNRKHLQYILNFLSKN